MPLPTAYGTIPLGGALPEAYIEFGTIPVLGGALESSYGQIDPAIQMTAAASGSNGITVADDDDIDFGTGDFFLHWEGSLPDWTPGASQRVLRKYDAAAAGFILNVNTNGTLAFSLFAGAGLLSYDSTTATGLQGGSIAKVTVSVVRSSASTAGSVTFYLNGTQLGSPVSIAAAASITASTSTAMAICGGDGTTGTQRTASNTISCIVGNFAPTAAEVLDLCTNGIPESWKWGSQTALSLETNFETGSLVGSGLLSGADGTYAINSTSPISGVYDGKFVYSSGSSSIYITTTNIPVSTTKTYRLSFDVKGSKSGLTIGRVQARTNTTGAASGASQNLTGSASITTTTSRASFTFIPSIAIQSFRLDTLSGFSAADEFQIDNIQVVQIGATFAALPETIPASGALAWTDSSGNTAGGTLPAAGATKVTIRR